MAKFEKFHGADMVGLDGTNVLLQIANFVACAYRGNAERRRRWLSAEMRRLITEDDDGTIAFQYLGLADLLGRRTAYNGVLLRETTRTHISRVVRNGIHNLRRRGIDVELITHARQGEHEIMLVIKPGFRHNDESVPVYMKSERENPFTMTEILELVAPPTQTRRVG